MASDTPRMDWTKLLNATRYGRETPPDGVRTNFQRDIDRILFSDHFRRLARKTQVHPLNENDHIHSRLTHSLEVASVGKSLGEMIGSFLKGRGELPDTVKPYQVGEIVQAACLAHDIGNPPFGHSGEEAIKDWFLTNEHWYKDDDGDPILDAEYLSDFTKFDGNAMAVRVMLSTGFYQDGMSPTHAVLGALLKYPWPSCYDAGKPKFSFFQTEAKAMEEIAETLGLIEMDGRYSRPPLAYLTEAADDICYRTIDLEDGTEMGILDDMFMYDSFADALGLRDDTRYADLPDKHFRQRNSVVRAKLIHAATQEAAEIFKTHYDAIMTGQFDRDASLMHKSEGGICQTMRQVYAEVSKTLFLSRRKAVLELGAQNALGRLLDQTMAEVANLCNDRKTANRDKVKILLGNDIVDRILADENPCRYRLTMAVVDYISGMTDHYATDLCRKFLGLGY